MKYRLILLAPVAVQAAVLWCGNDVTELEVSLGSDSQARTKEDISVGQDVNVESVQVMVNWLSSLAPAGRDPLASDREKIARKICDVAGPAARCDSHCWKYYNVEPIHRFANATVCRAKNSLPPADKNTYSVFGAVFDEEAYHRGDCAKNLLTDKCLGLPAFCDLGLDSLLKADPDLSKKCNTRREHDLSLRLTVKPEHEPPSSASSNQMPAGGHDGESGRDGSSKVKPAAVTKSTTTAPSHEPTVAPKQDVPDSVVPSREQDSQQQQQQSTTSATSAAVTTSVLPAVPQGDVQEPQKEVDSPAAVADTTKNDAPVAAPPVPPPAPPARTPTAPPPGEPQNQESGSPLCISYPASLDAEVDRLLHNTNAVGVPKIPEIPKIPGIPEMLKMPKMPKMRRNPQTVPLNPSGSTGNSVTSQSTSHSSSSTGKACSRTDETLLCSISAPEDIISKIKKLNVHVENGEKCAGTVRSQAVTVVGKRV
ncbi:hypothetical protein CDD83_256 [Cordyceps sp. RAO-2017]|nr:hypothetical protein CDD83_256 [Cordyceps sp. RAO-2017]